VGVLTRHLMEPNKYASWTLLLGLWAPDTMYLLHQYVITLPRYVFGGRGRMPGIQLVAENIALINYCLATQLHNTVHVQ